MASHDIIMAAAGVGGAGPEDTSFKNVSLLLTGNGTNGAQNNTFLDSSTNNFTITRNGNTTQGTFSPYGDLWSNYFDGSGDYLSVPDNAAFDVGSGDFTIECWLNPSSTPSGGQYFCGQGDAGTTTGTVSVFMYRTNTGTIIGRFQATDAEYYGNASTATAPVGVWTHVAYVRQGNTTRLYVNGVQSATTDVTGKTVPNSPTIFAVGAVGLLTTNQYHGYISNFRFQKGVCQYPNGTTFTPSTTPLTAVSGTSLLTCQSNRFKDNSSNNFAITVNGNTSVQRFSPFNPTAPYSAATLGGSGYFATLNDYLSLADNNALDPETSDFCIEFWVYKIGGSNSGFFGFGPNSGGIGMYFESGAAICRIAGSDVLSASFNNLIGAWTHVAVTRSSGTARLFLNGVQISSVSNSTNINSSLEKEVGRYNNGYGGTHYMNGFRVVKGSAVYTTNFTPPTTPLTAITNTSLLTNFTNAGIPDAAMMNDLETVGNAQVSTSVKKYGTGSLYFDGTGDYLSVPDGPGIEFGSGDFTMEAWVYTANAATRQTIIAKTNSGGNDASSAFVWQIGKSGAETTGLLSFYHSAATTYITASTALSSNTWYHIAIVRSGNTFTQYINGTANGTASISTAIRDIVEPLCVGGALYGVTLNGYIDDLRITKGIARYTANFTPPTAALPTY